MAFPGFPPVANIALEGSLPPVAALGAGAPIDAAMLHAARKRVQMIVSEVGDRATVSEATDADLKKHELFNAKLNEDAVAGGMGAVAMPPWALLMQAGLQADIRAVGERVGGVETSVARLNNCGVHAAADTIVPVPGAFAPFVLPAAAVPAVHFPADLAGFAALTAAQCAALLSHYGLAALPAAAVPAGHGAAAQAAAAAANKIALMAGLDRVGRHIGLRMDDSWEADVQRDVRRAFNASATVAAHALQPLRGPYPPFGLPVQFPATAGAFRAMTLPEAKQLCSFYSLPPPAAGAGAGEELVSRRAAIAVHVGFRE